jgi:hypothetical protein
MASRPYITTDPVRVKFREAIVHFGNLSKIDGMEQFYATLNAFLTAGRGVLYIARHELGWQERRKEHRKGFTPQQMAERQKFDTWYESAPEIKAVLAHPLAEERHNVTHRDGQAGFVHIPKPIGGLAVSEGTPFRQAPFIRTGRGGRFGLPLEDKNNFFYVKADGSKVDAVPYCKKYLDLLENAFLTIDHGLWRT